MNTVEDIIAKQVIASRSLDDNVILTALKEKYYIGNNRNAAEQKWLQQQISVYLIQQIKKCTDLKLDDCMPTTEEACLQFKGSVPEILDTLSYLIDKDGSEVRLTHVHYSRAEEKVTYYYSCSLRRSPKERKSRRSRKGFVGAKEVRESDSSDTEPIEDEEDIDDDDDMEEEKQIAEEEITADHACEESTNPLAPVFPDEDGGKTSAAISSLLASVEMRKEMSHHGACGRRCPFKVTISHSLKKDDLHHGLVTIEGVHTGHNPFTDPHHCRSIHSAIEEGIRFCHLSGQRSFQCIGDIQAFSSNYKTRRDYNFEKFRVAVESFPKVSISNIVSPVVPSRAYGAKDVVEQEQYLDKLSGSLFGAQSALCSAAVKSFLAVSSEPSLSRSSAEIEGIRLFSSDNFLKVAEPRKDVMQEESVDDHSLGTYDVMTGSSESQLKGDSTNEFTSADLNPDTLMKGSSQRHEVADYSELQTDSSDILSGSPSYLAATVQQVPKAMYDNACHEAITGINMPAPVPPPTGCPSEELEAYLSALIEWLKVHVPRSGSVPLSWIPEQMPLMPKMFSCYNFDITKEKIQRRLTQLRREDRGGLTVSQDLMNYFCELERAGWATIRPGTVIKDGLIEEFGILIQTPLMKHWAKTIPGITEVMEMDDTYNTLAFQLPFFAMLGHDPSTNLELPIMFSFSVYKQGCHYAKARMICWKILTWYATKENPEFVLHLSDMDASTLIGLHMAYTQLLVTRWVAFTAEQSVAQCMKSVVIAIPKQQSDATALFLMMAAKVGHTAIDMFDLTASFDTSSWVLMDSDFYSSSAFLMGRGWIAAYVPDKFVGTFLAHIFSKMQALFEEAQSWVAKHNSKDVRQWSAWEKQSLGLWQELMPVLQHGTALYSLLRSVLYKTSKICVFHVKQAWIENGQSKFSDKDEWCRMYQCLENLMFQDTEKEFHEYWNSLADLWSHSVPGKKMLKYVKSFWMECIELWAMCFRKRLSHRGRDVSGACESLFYVIKYHLFGGYRPSDARAGFQKLYAAPNCPDNRSYLRVLETRRVQMLNGAPIDRTGDNINRRRTNVLNLLDEWKTNADKIKCLDPLALIFEVPGFCGNKDKSECLTYIVSLISSTCPCGVRSMTCKHILALRAWAIVHLKLPSIWNDYELDTVFREDELREERSPSRHLTPFSPPRCFPQHGDLRGRRSGTRSTPPPFNQFHDEFSKVIVSLQQGVERIRLLRKNASLDSAVKGHVETISLKVSEMKGAIDSLVDITTFTLQPPSRDESAPTRRREHSGEDDEFIPHAAYGPDDYFLPQLHSLPAMVTSSSSLSLRMPLTGNRFVSGRNKPLASTVAGQTHQSFSLSSNQGRQEAAAFPLRRKYVRTDASTAAAAATEGGGDTVSGSSMVRADVSSSLHQATFGSGSYDSPGHSKRN